MTARLRNPLVGIAVTVAFGFGDSTTNAQKVYWTDPSSRKIQRADMDGNSVEDLVTTAPSSASAIALDLMAGKMYFGGDVHRANLDGSQIEVILDTDVWGIALDLSGGKFYWADRTAA